MSEFEVINLHKAWITCWRILSFDLDEDNLSNDLQSIFWGSEGERVFIFYLHFLDFFLNF